MRPSVPVFSTSSRTVSKARSLASRSQRLTSKPASGKVAAISASMKPSRSSGPRTTRHGTAEASPWPGMPFSASASETDAQRSRQRKCPIALGSSSAPSRPHESGLTPWSRKWKSAIEPPSKSTTTWATSPLSTKVGRPLTSVSARATFAPCSAAISKKILIIAI